MVIRIVDIIWFRSRIEERGQIDVGEPAASHRPVIMLSTVLSPV